MINFLKKGVIISYILVFSFIFLMMLSGLLGFILIQLRQSTEKLAWNESLEVAEAGINYYRWCINNEAEDQCEMEKDYLDPSGILVGHFSLEINSKIACGATVQRNIVSTGWTAKFPSVKRKISAIYTRESIAKYSYILNNDVWVGADHQIRGPYQCNGGIRMDGSNQSSVSSAKNEWACNSSFGCSPCPTANGCHIDGSTCICPGVFTTTANPRQDLFNFPVPPFDFNGVTIDLAIIKDKADDYPQDKYWPPVTTIDAQGKGYHVKFKDNGTIEVWIITRLNSVYGYSLEENWHYDYFLIQNEYLYKTVSIDPSCSVYFFEDNLWVEGVVNGTVTMASANLIDANKDTDIVLPGNIDYVSLNNTDALGLIGERNILIGPQSPNNTILRGIFLAQKGRFSRNHYQNNFRDSLVIYGSIISNGRVGTQWTSSGIVVSGYYKRESYIDPNMIYQPPPYVPYLNPQFKMINWEEL